MEIFRQMGTPDGVRFSGKVSWDLDLLYLYRNFIIVSDITATGRTDKGLLGSEVFRVIADYGNGPKEIITATVNDIASIQDMRQPISGGAAGDLRSVTFPNMMAEATENDRSCFVYHFSRAFADEVTDKLLGFGTQGLKSLRCEIELHAAASYGTSAAIVTMEAFAYMDTENEAPGIIPMIRNVSEVSIGGSGYTELVKLPQNSLASLSFIKVGGSYAPSGYRIENDGQIVTELKPEFKVPLGLALHYLNGLCNPPMAVADGVVINFMRNNRFDEVVDTRQFNSSKISVATTGACTLRVLQEILGAVTQ